MGYVEAPSQCSLFEVLDARILDAVKVSVFKNAKKWFVVSGYEQVGAAKSEHTRMLKTPGHSQSLAFSWLVSGLSIFSEARSSVNEFPAIWTTPNIVFVCACTMFLEE